MLRGWEKKKFSASFCRLRNKTQGDQTASPRTLRAGIASEYPEIPTPTSTQRSLLHQGTLEKPLALIFVFYFTFFNPSHSTTLAGAVVHKGRDIQPASDSCHSQMLGKEHPNRATCSNISPLCPLQLPSICVQKVYFKCSKARNGFEHPSLRCAEV